MSDLQKEIFRLVSGFSTTEPLNPIVGEFGNDIMYKWLVSTESHSLDIRYAHMNCIISLLTLLAPGGRVSFSGF